MFNHYVLCSDELTCDKNTIFFYTSYIINDLKSKGLIFDMVHYWSDGPSSQLTSVILSKGSWHASWLESMTVLVEMSKMLFRERFCRIKLLLEIFSLLLPLPKKSFLILPLKSLNWMKYVMQHNNSLNTSRNILSTFTAHKNSITLPLKTRKLLVTS